ncbi:DedA family protein [Acinetobacter kookii]
MNWADLLQHYGYFAIFIGTLLEGETVLILGAYAVHQHIFHFWILIMVAMAGSFVGDQFYYQIGARYGQKIIQSKPQLGQKFAQASSVIDNYPVLTILLMRFAWGLRTILPISIGIKAYPLGKYILVNLLACFIWDFVVVSVGLQISHWLHAFWVKILPYHQDIYIMLAVVGCILLARMIYTLLIQHKNSIK